MNCVLVHNPALLVMPLRSPLPAILVMSGGHKALWLSFRYYMFTVMKFWLLDLVATHLSLSYSTARNVRNPVSISYAMYIEGIISDGS